MIIAIKICISLDIKNLQKEIHYKYNLYINRKLNDLQEKNEKMLNFKIY